MAPLRWILLLAGLVFIGALIAWESRRARREREQAAPGTGVPERSVPVISPAPLEAQYGGGQYGGGQYGGGQHGGGRTEPALGDLAHSQRRPAPWLQGVPTVLAPALPADADADADGDTAADAAADLETDWSPAADGGLADLSGDVPGDEPADEPGGLPAEAPAGAPLGAPPGPDDIGVLSEGVGAVREVEPMVIPQLPPTPPLVVDWPPEAERRIVSIRLLAGGGTRFAGRGLRQALAASGFIHGRFGIYHLPADDGRAIVSAASLSRPGILDPDSMDFQRFAGLNLFAVLPGALSAEATLDRLVHVGMDLAERLEGLLQDEQGAPLNAARVAGLRAQLQAPLAAPPAAAAAAAQVQAAGAGPEA